MATQKPLVEMIPAIVDHIERHEDTLLFNRRIFKILEGQLRREIEASLTLEIISPAALQRAKQRIPSINLLKKVTDKLSRVYSTHPTRITDDKTDAEIMAGIVRDSSLNNKMMDSNQMFNAQRMCAIEPFVKDGKIKVRVIGGHQCLAYSDDPTDPMNMTVFIKLLGTETKAIFEQVVDREGRDVRNEQIEIEVNIYALYSDDEFLIIDSQGAIRKDKMIALGHPSTKNEFGVIPQVYINKSRFELVPLPNQTGLDMSILIPKILVDMNYAFQFMSHSIIWTKNSDISGAEINPDALVNLGDSNPDGGEPEIGTIQPTTDIEKGLMLAQFQLSGYMATEGIKTGNVGSMMPGREASGFAKAIDEGDASEEVKKQAEVYRDIELKFWEVMTKLRKVWATEGLIDDKRQFSQSFTPTFAIRYAETKALKTDAQKIEEVGKLMEIGLISRRQAIKTMNPEFSELQVDAWEKELDKEADRKMEKMFELSPATTSEDEGTSSPDENIGREENGTT